MPQSPVPRNPLPHHNAARTQQERSKRERVTRYIARPPIARERLSVDHDGRVVLELQQPFRDGTTHVVFTPQEFHARLAALVPRPRVNLTRYHGVFAPCSSFRRHIVPAGKAQAQATPAQ